MASETSAPPVPHPGLNVARPPASGPAAPPPPGRAVPSTCWLYPAPPPAFWLNECTCRRLGGNAPRMGPAGPFTTSSQPGTRPSTGSASNPLALPSDRSRANLVTATKTPHSLTRLLASPHSASLCLPLAHKADFRVWEEDPISRPLLQPHTPESERLHCPCLSRGSCS